MKKCPKCNTIKETSDFYLSKKHKIQSYCKDCQISRLYELKNKNPNWDKEYREKLKDDPARYDKQKKRQNSWKNNTEKGKALKVRSIENRKEKYYSDLEYREHRKKIINKAKQKRRFKKRNQFVCNVDFIDIFKRDNGKCQLCNKKVDLKHTAPHRKSATLDHIIPISKGGLHEQKNVQLAHYSCNAKKGNRVWGNGEQLRMFGT